VEIFTTWVVSPFEIGVWSIIVIFLVGRATHGSHAAPGVARRRARSPTDTRPIVRSVLNGDLEVRFVARPSNGPQVPHQRDELYFVASGTGRYRVEDTVTAVGPGDVLFCAAHVAHGFEDISEDFSVWVLFYGQQK